MASLSVDAPQRGAGADEQRLGGVHAAVDVGGDLGDRQAADIAQRQRDALRDGALGQRGVGRLSVDPLGPGVVGALGLGFGLNDLRLALLAGGAAPVVDQLGTGNPDQPGDREPGRTGLIQRGDGGRERLGGQVLGQRDAPAAGQEVAVHLGKGARVDRHQWIGLGSWIGVGGHT
jgi:hypothetical protein